MKNKKNIKKKESHQKKQKKIGLNKMNYNQFKIKNKLKNKIVYRNKNKSKQNSLNLMILKQKLFSSQNN